MRINSMVSYAKRARTTRGHACEVAPTLGRQGRGDGEELGRGADDGSRLGGRARRVRPAPELGEGQGAVEGREARRRAATDARPRSGFDEGDVEESPVPVDGADGADVGGAAVEDAGVEEERLARAEGRELRSERAQEPRPRRVVFAVAPGVVRGAGVRPRQEGRRPPARVAFSGASGVVPRARRARLESQG